MNINEVIDQILTTPRADLHLNGISKPTAIFNLCEAYDYAMAQKIILIFI